MTSRLLTIAFLLCSVSALGAPKIIHVYVALCDNDTQGIVPVPKLIGNGNDPRNNLYWGALYGVKTYFNRSNDWELVYAKSSKKGFIMERCAFRHKSTKALLIADAYRGSRIKACIQSYLIALSGRNAVPVTLDDGEVVKAGGQADIIVYIGHNGLMEFKLPSPEMKKPSLKPAIILACSSRKYFTPHLKNTGATPLLLTNGFMAPEAYTLHDALNTYFSTPKSSSVAESAAKAYAKYQRCSVDAARKLFYPPDAD